MFRNRANAARLVEKLKEKGYDAKTAIIERNGYMKVIVGYYATKQEALEARRQLKKDGFNSILRWR